MKYRQTRARSSQTRAGPMNGVRARGTNKAVRSRAAATLKRLREPNREPSGPAPSSSSEATAMGRVLTRPTWNTVPLRYTAKAWK